MPGGYVPGGGASWRPLGPVEGVVQRFPGCLWGVGGSGGESQAVYAAWQRRELVVRCVCGCPSDLAVVVPLHCPLDVPVFEDVYFCGGRGSVHCVPADELNGADNWVGLRGRSHVEDWADVLGGKAHAAGVLRHLGWSWRGAVLPEAPGRRRGVHGRDQDVFGQPFHHEVVCPFKVSGDGGFRL